MTIEISVASHIGKYRKKQEDAFLVEYDPVKDEHLLVVADGMGGHEHGKWAADTCVEIFEENSDEPLENLCKLADETVSLGPPGFIRRFSSKSPGTTVSMEPQIGIRGRGGLAFAFYIEIQSFNGAPDWNPGRARGTATGCASCSPSFNGAPDWNPGKGENLRL